MKHLKKFSSDTDRIAYESGSNYIEPYVSLVSEDGSSHYNAPFLCKLTLNDGSIVRRTGNGELKEAMISMYKSTCIKAEIGKLCTSIGTTAFSDWKNLSSITISDSVTKIGYAAFDGCSSLTSVTIPNSVTTIVDRAFAYCKGLTSVTIGNSVTSIGNFAFTDCSGLTSVHITDLAAWCKIAFNTGDSNPLSYAHRLYLNGVEITDLVIPNSVISIGNYTFNGCSGFTSLTIGNSVTSIERGAFSSCSDLTSIQVESGNTTYDSRNDCNAIIETTSNTLITGCKNTVIPNSVTSIGNYAFWKCNSPTSMTIPNSVKSIGEGAFRECNLLKTVICEGYVENIGVNAFYQENSKSQLETVEFRGGIGTSGKSIFYGCVNLKTIKYNSNTLPTYNITSTQTPWGSVTATNTCGYTNRTAGTNIFYCPSTSTYTEAEIDPYNNGSLFSTEYSGFTISRTL